MTGAPNCSDCEAFEQRASFIEHALPGLRALSSGLAATRSSDGWCRLHDRLLRATSSCAAFEARGAYNPAQDGTSNARDLMAPPD